MRDEDRSERRAVSANANLPTPQESPAAWTVRRAEQLLSALAGVLSARIVADRSGEIEEIHVLVTQEIQPKQAVRNVESALMAQLGIRVDHRKISVAQTADVKPIAHLYKTQVFQLARHLGVPDEILTRQPTTDTYPLAQTQEEFYFGLPYAQMDLCLYGRNNGVPAVEVAAASGLTPEQVERVFADIDQKRRATRYQHQPPLLASPVREVAG